MSKQQRWSFVPGTTSDGSHDCACIEDRDGYPLAGVWNESKGPLMAAAPELLDACKGLAGLAYSLINPDTLPQCYPQCYRDAVAIFDRLEGRDDGL